MPQRKLRSVALVVLTVAVTLTLDRLAIGQAEPAQQGDAYRVERIEGSPEQATSELNQKYKDGWELVDANNDLWIFKKKDVLNAPLRPR